MKELNLETLRTSIPYVTKVWISLMAESAMVCFLSQSHESGTILKLHVEKSSNYLNKKKNTKIVEYQVNWDTEFSDTDLLSFNDKDKTTDFGAMGIALLCVSELTDYDEIIFSEGNNGYDFHLINSTTTDEENFVGDARMEVSGIRREKPSNSLRSRVKSKIKQTKISDFELSPVYISVTEFHKPEGVFLQRDDI